MGMIGGIVGSRVWLRLAGAVFLVIIAFTVFGASNAQACPTSYPLVGGKTLNSPFVCPNGTGPTYTGNDFDEVPHFKLTSPNGGIDPITPTPAAPGATIQETLSYTADFNGSNIYAWLNVESRNNLAGVTTAFDDSATQCPAFWDGSHSDTATTTSSPYSNEAKAASYGHQPGDDLTGANLNYNSDGFTGGCGAFNFTKNWIDASVAAGQTVTHNFNYRIDSSANPGTICASGHLSEGGRTSLKARSHVGIGAQCFQVPNRINVKITVLGGGTSSSTPKPRFNQAKCGGSLGAGDALSLDSQSGSGSSTKRYYNVSIVPGLPYCVTAVDGNGYTLSKQSPSGDGAGNEIYQVAGLKCSSAHSLYNPLYANCDSTSNLTDYLGDAYTFTYTHGDCGAGCAPPDVTVSGRIYDRVDNSDMPDDSVAALMYYGGNSCGVANGFDNVQNGDYAFTLPVGEHFCVNTTPTDFVWPGNGYHYKDVAPAEYSEQVAGLDCRSYSQLSTLGMRCVGWNAGDGATSGWDNSHLSYSVDTTTADCDSAGNNCRVTSGTGSAGHCNGGNNIGFTHTPAGRSSPYQENEACSQTRTIRSYTGDDTHKVTSHDNYTKRRTIASHGNEDGSCSNYSGSSDGHNHTCTNLAEDHDGPIAGRCPAGLSGSTYPTRCVNDPTNENVRTGLCSTSYDYAGNGQACTNTSYRIRYSDTQAGKQCSDSLTGDHQGVSVTDCDESRTLERYGYLAYPNDHPSDNDYNFAYTSYVTISGRDFNANTITGSPQSAQTGYAPVLTVCNVGSYNHNDNTGDFNFELVRNTLFCIRDPQYKYDPTAGNWNSGYAIDGPYINTAYQLSGLSYENQVAAENRTGYNFVYTNPKLVGITKHVYSDYGNTNLIDGQPVLPRQDLHYTVTAYNGGSATSNYRLEDFIPQNIDPTNFTVEASELDGNPVAYSVASPGLEPVYGAGPGCGAQPCTPKMITIDIPNLPAGSTVRLSWTGRVRGADTVGVFPIDHRFCSNANDWSASNQGYASPCEDRSNSGWQATSNFARSAYHYGYSSIFSGWGYNADGSGDGRGGAASRTDGAIDPTPLPVVNPIPGEVKCALKKSVGPFDDNDLPITTVPACGQTPAFTSNFGYVPASPDFNHAVIDVLVETESTKGPVDLQVDDGIVSTSGAPYTLKSLDNAIVSNTQPGSPAVSAGVFGTRFGTGNIVTWPNTTSTEHAYGSATHDHTMQVTFDSDGGPGYTFTNTARACWIPYWQASRALQCAKTNPVKYTSFNVSTPFVDTKGGDVHAGGSSTSSSSSLCSSTVTTNGGQGIVYGNSPNIGDYFVTSSGTVPSASDIRNGVQSTSRNIAKIGNGAVGVIQRPNMCEVAKKLSASNPSLSTPYNLATDDTSYDGKVEPANAPIGSPFMLGSGVGGSSTTINHRWTLYVKGDLYIGADVNYGTPSNDPSSGKESSHPSFGVVVDGNIYIDKNVKHLDGYYIASGLINTCAGPTGNSVKYSLYGGGTSGGTYTVPDCSDPAYNPFTVRGALYAKTFRFNRTTHTAAAAETISYDNRIYTATPPGFNNLAAVQQLSQFLIEPLPRY